jgi:hypothetical protein
MANSSTSLKFHTIEDTIFRIKHSDLPARTLPCSSKIIEYKSKKMSKERFLKLDSAAFCSKVSGPSPISNLLLAVLDSLLWIAKVSATYAHPIAFTM